MMTKLVQHNTLDEHMASDPVHGNTNSLLLVTVQDHLLCTRCL